MSEPISDECEVCGSVTCSLHNNAILCSGCIPAFDAGRAQMALDTIKWLRGRSPIFAKQLNDEQRIQWKIIS